LVLGPLDFKKQFKETLSQRRKIPFQDTLRRPSAVLIPVYFQQGQYHILFTRRTERVRYHKREISFPGGGYHIDDGSLLNTALRESSEEIGLAPEDVEVLGELDNTPTRYSDYIITPFVGFIRPDYDFTPSDFEIAEIMRIPIATLLDKSCFRQESPIALSGMLFIPYVYTYQGKTIIGATARILNQFLEIFSHVIGQSQPSQ
jgi:8-oxo-dGTP pyrophosphatase MutT (NUDIX family)